MHELIVFTAIMGTKPKKEASFVDLSVPLISNTPVTMAKAVSTAAGRTSNFTATRCPAELHLKGKRLKARRMAR